jgi:23S rRNA (cytidine1920-2'-O)/16S rRNA (cytidine1409-2'-O)-methyltransferase
VLTFAQDEGLALKGLIRSPLLGPKGNVEFLVWLDRASSGEAAQDAGQWVDRALA